MTPDQEILWDKIRNFELDDPSSTFPFSLRLKNENRWSLEYTLRTVHEYKKFIFLSCIATHPLTPSDQVDQVWHLHLIYTRSYWQDLCCDTINKEIHHGPTKGGNDENNKYNDLYSRTLEFYKSIFGHTAPKDIWPKNKERFKGNFVRIDLIKHWIIKNPFKK